MGEGEEIHREEEEEKRLLEELEREVKALAEEEREPPVEEVVLAEGLEKALEETKEEPPPEETPEERPAEEAKPHPERLRIIYSEFTSTTSIPDVVSPLMGGAVVLLGVSLDQAGEEGLRLALANLKTAVKVTGGDLSLIEGRRMLLLTPKGVAVEVR